MFSLKTLLYAITIISATTAHSWLDCVGYSGSAKGAFCKGYPRSYPGREAQVVTDEYTVRINDRPSNAPVCGGGQTSPTYSSKFPMATARAGESLTLSWQANGHYEKPAHTQVHIHWTGKPGTQLETYGELSSANTVATMEFANKAICVDPNDDNTVCTGALPIPVGTKPGKYFFVWRWVFDNNPSGEEYTTCFDVQVTA